MSHPLRLCSAAEVPPFQAAKWLSFQLLLDPEEMKSLFDSLGEFYIYRVGAVCKEGQEEVSREDFLKAYTDYVNALKSGILPNPASYRSLFAVVFTVTRDVLVGIRAGEGETIVRVAMPVIQVQPHSMHYSKSDHKFRPMLFGLDTITWGVQFSYPQLYQDQQLQDIRKVDNSADFPNTPLFRSVQQWQREHTIPTPFLVPDQTKVNVPMRVGKKCLEWINRHPQLISNSLQVIL